MNRVRIGLAQVNTTVGDLEGNVRQIADGIDRARRRGAQIVAFPEMTITGYSPQDLLLRPDFLGANLAALEQIVPATRGLTAVVGFVDRQDEVYSAAAVLNDGRLAGVYHKLYLPNYGVFDESRYFHAGETMPVFCLGRATVGVSICEDIWYSDGPARYQALLGNAELVINIAASPYSAGKGASRERMLATRAVDNACCLAFCNLVGGQDGLVFDGHSLVVDERGAILARGKQFAADLLVIDLDLEGVSRQRLHDPRRRQERSRLCRQGPMVPATELVDTRSDADALPAAPAHCEQPLAPLPETYQALALGTRDYVLKNGFRRAVVALTGDVDSALTACVAADALGPGNVVGAFVPSPRAADVSSQDVEELARNLGIELRTPSSAAAYAPRGAPADGLERWPEARAEALQPLACANLAIALASESGWLVLSAANKSDVSVGRAMVQGDLAVLMDVYETGVLDLACWRNTQGAVIPARVLAQDPAGRRPGRIGAGSLPPYDLLVLTCGSM